jgi:hypothetical protein
MRSKPRSFRWLGPIAVSTPLAVLLVPSIARANDPAAAQALFDEAKQLASSGHYTEACGKFDESQKADPGLGTEFHLADCWQHIGRTASAWSLFRQIESEAHARGEASRERVAHDRATALEPFVSKLAIVPKGALPPEGLTVRRDGVEIGREQWGVPVPVDPGPHTVSIATPGKQPWGTGVDVPDNGRVFTMDLPPLADIPDVPGVAVASVVRAPTPAPVPVPAPATGGYPPAAFGAPPPRPAVPTMGVTSAMPEGVSPVSPEIPSVENRGVAQRAVGWALVGAGIAGLGAGAYFTVQWMNDRSDSNPHCNGNLCDAQGFQLRHDATSQGRAAIIAGGSGLAGLVIGSVVIATAPTPRIVSSHIARATGIEQIRLVPVVGLHEGGLGLAGNW